MPKAVPYTVTFPDGHEQKFMGDDAMTDEQVYQRAQQERAFSDGKISTTFAGGAAKELGNDTETTAALMTGAGLLTGGAAPIVGTAMMAAAPTVARGLKYATEKMSGQEPTPISITDIMKSVAGPALAYGPGAIMNSGKALEGAVSRLPVAGLPSWAVKESAPIVEGAANAVGKVAPQSMMKTIGDVGSKVGDLATSAAGATARAGTGVSADDLRLLHGLIDNGMNRQAAIKIISQGDPQAAQTLTRLLTMSPFRAAASRIGDMLPAAVPAAAAFGGEPSRVGDTSSSTDLLARQQRDAVKSQLNQRISGR
jgi:hypothetical protein